MADYCRECRGSGRVQVDPISDYSPAALPGWRLCDCQPINPGPARVHPDDALAAVIATLNFCYWEAPSA